MFQPNRNLIKAFVLISLPFFVASCSKKDHVTDNNPDTVAQSTIDSTAITAGTAEGSQENGADPDDLVEGSTFSSTVSINFGSSVTISNPLTGSGVSIVQTGANVVINSSVDAVEYTISGTTTNGSVKIYSSKKFKVTLNNANITSTNGPAINIQSKKRAFIVLADGTTNTLTDGPNYATSTEDMKGTFFSEAQLIFSGNGSLNVQGNYKHAIVSDDYIRIRSGNITVTGAVKDGIHTNSAFIADGGTLKVTAPMGDAIECEAGYVIINNGNLTLNANDHGITASYTDTDPEINPYVNINGGTININSTAGEGMESKSDLTINKGNISIHSSDDGLNAATGLYINGGTIYTVSDLNDGMDSNGNISITGGKTVAIGGPAPEASIDCDTRVLKITGGIVVGAGAATSAPSAAASTINSVILNGSAANQLLHIEAADGKEALTFKIPSAYTTLVYASAKLKTGTTYNVYTGGSASGGSTNFNGLYLSGTYNGGTKAASFTTSTRVTQLGGTVSAK